MPRFATMEKSVPCHRCVRYGKCRQRNMLPDKFSVVFNVISVYIKKIVEYHQISSMYFLIELSVNGELYLVQT